MNGKIIQIICPTRQRASRCEGMLNSFFDTRTDHETRIWCYVDEKDPELAQYQDLFNRMKIEHMIGPHLFLADALNLGCWDKMLVDAIENNGGIGMSYGRTRSCPGAVMVSANCIRALGWFFPPAFKHQFGDTAMNEIYQENGMLYYVPEVWMEHFHPDYGMAAHDPTYQIMRDTWGDGEAQFHHWRGHHKSEDVARLSRLKSMIKK
jgi:hypothetical protein